MLASAYPDLPMEKVYVRQPKTDVPQVFLREAGRGRVAYVCAHAVVAVDV